MSQNERTLSVPKPEAVKQAQLFLWAWTAWKCLYGVYESWTTFPEAQRQVQEQSHGLIVLDFNIVMATSVGFYATLALAMWWVIAKLNDGKNWVRVALAVNLVLTFAAAFFMKTEGWLDYWTVLPDAALQIYALWLLYTWPGRTWFNREEWAVVSDTTIKTL